MLVIKNEKVRNWLKLLLPFVVIPVTVLAGAMAFAAKQYLLVSLLITIWTLLLFLTGFEKKKTGSRRMVIAAVMTALCIVGRFIPFFKPITALTIITAVYLGGETGFLVGAMAALLSNFYFGQGPWTPFQMLAWGMIGLTAGYLGKALKRRKALLLIFGVLSGVMYSLTMDVWTVLWYDGGFNASLYRGAVLASLPHMALYGISNFAFLFICAKPFGEKLERVKLKYGV